MNWDAIGAIGEIVGGAAVFSYEQSTETIALGTCLIWLGGTDSLD